MVVEDGEFLLQGESITADENHLDSQVREAFHGEVIAAPKCPVFANARSPGGGYHGCVPPVAASATSVRFAQYSGYGRMIRDFGRLLRPTPPGQERDALAVDMGSQGEWASEHQLES